MYVLTTPNFIVFEEVLKAFRIYTEHKFYFYTTFFSVFFLHIKYSFKILFYVKSNLNKLQKYLRVLKYTFLLLEIVELNKL